jgi:hypothetical protein
MLVVALVAVGSQRAQASPQRLVEGVHFAESLQIQDVQLVMRGAGLLRYMIFIRAYVGALYLPPETRNADVLETVPRRLEISYFHAIQAEALARATREKIADNVSPEALTALEPRLDEFNSLYRNIEPGDRYGLTYIPGRGTELDLNGQILGLVEGDDFGRAVFSIWLGRDPIDSDFKSALLGAS